MMDKWDEALYQAIILAGNQAKLAKILNIGRWNISHWKRNRAVPAQHALEIERIFGINAQDFNRPNARLYRPKQE